MESNLREWIRLTSKDMPLWGQDKLRGQIERERSGGKNQGEKDLFLRCQKLELIISGAVCSFLSSSIVFFGFCFWPPHVTCGILVPQSGIEPSP